MKKKSYGIDEDMNLKLVIGLSRTVQHIRQSELPTIKGGGLTLAQFSVLEALFHKGDLKVCELIEKTLSTGGNMTVVIANLERDGMVRRYKDPLDQRINFITLTEKGSNLIGQIFPIHVQGLNETFKHLDYNEKQQLVALLKKISGKK